MAESGNSSSTSSSVAPVEAAEHAEWMRAAVREHGDALLRYATRLLRPAERDLARDVVQDVFVKLCQAERGQVEDHLVEWLFTVCRNRSFDILRKESRMTVLSTFEGPGQTGEGAATKTNNTVAVNVIAPLNKESAAVDEPDDLIEKPETTNVVLNALSELPANQQEVIRLKFQSGLSYKEIAGITDLSIANVGFLIHAGIKTLRQRFGGAEGGAIPAVAAAAVMPASGS